MDNGVFTILILLVYEIYYCQTFILFLRDVAKLKKIPNNQKKFQTPKKNWKWMGGSSDILVGKLKNQEKNSNLLCLLVFKNKNWTRL